MIWSSERGALDDVGPIIYPNPYVTQPHFLLVGQPCILKLSGNFLYEY